MELHVLPPARDVFGASYRIGKDQVRGSLRCENSIRSMSAWGLGCAKTPAVAPHVEISPDNCIPESQIILHSRGSTPCWRIVFSTFCGCMSFYTGSVKSGLGVMSAPMSGLLERRHR